MIEDKLNNPDKESAVEAARRILNAFWKKLSSQQKESLYIAFHHLDEADTDDDASQKDREAEFIKLLEKAGFKEIETLKKIISLLGIKAVKEQLFDRLKRLAKDGGENLDKAHIKYLHQQQQHPDFKDAFEKAKNALSKQVVIASNLIAQEERAAQEQQQHKQQEQSTHDGDNNGGTFQQRVR